MSKIIFNEHQQRILEANPNVASVSDRAIQYTPEFKIYAVKEYQTGKGPAQIFSESGFDLTVIGSKKASSSLNRWRTTYRTYGEEGFFEERRGKGSTGRPSEKDLSAEKKLEKAEARIKYLEAENDRNRAPVSATTQFIHDNCIQIMLHTGTPLVFGCSFSMFIRKDK